MKIDTGPYRSTTELVRLTLFFAAGLVIGRAADISSPAGPVFTALLLLSLPLFYLIKRKTRLSLSIVIFLPLGVVLSNGYGSPDSSPYSIVRYVNGEKACVEGRVLERDEGRDGTVFLVMAESIVLPGKTLAVKGRLRLSIASGASYVDRGDRIRFIARLKRPRNFGNPGGFDYERFLADRGIYATAFMPDDRYIAVVERGSGLSYGFSRLRRQSRSIIDDSIKDASSGILKAISIGDKSGLDEDLMEVFRKTGTAHILAISGLHMGIAAFFFFFIFKRLLSISERLLMMNMVTRLAAIFTFIPLTVYLLMSGMSISAMRAFIMAAAFLLSIIIGREKDTFNSIALAALAILVFWPQALFDVAFQLSFAAVIAIVYICPRIEGILFRDNVDTVLNVVRRPLSFLVVSAVAIAGTAPLTAHYFMEMSLVGMAGNVIAIPLIGFAGVPLSMLSLMIAPLSPDAAAMILGLAGDIAAFAAGLLRQLASLPFSSVLVFPPDWHEIVLFYLLIWSLLNLQTKAARAAVLLIPAFYMMPLAEKMLISKDKGPLCVTFLSVGQGESTVVRFPGGKVMLIDGGGFYNDSFDVGRMVIRPYLLSQGIKKIDYMLMTHPHPDHIGGLLHILREFDVAELWSSGDAATEEKHRALAASAIEKHIPERSVSGGDASASIDGVRIDFLMPDKSLLSRDNSNSEINKRSVVIRLVYGMHSILLAADMEAESEERLLERGVDIKANVIKVGHHGSLTSSGPDFIRAVSPDYAVFTAGYKNRFGFPKDEIVKRYVEKGAAVYRTDLDGAIRFSTDGKSMAVSVFRASKGEL